MVRIAMLVPWLALSWAVLAASSLRAEPAPAPVSDAAEGDILEGLEVLEPKAPRSEAQQDRLEALSLFAAARTLQQRDDLDGALRLYQRALRFDPNSTLVVEQIMTLATALDRSAEAIRYALLASDRIPKEPLLMRHLALRLADQGEVDRAIALYESTLALPELDRDSAGYLLLKAELAQLYHTHDRTAEAAAAFLEVQETIDDEQGAVAEERVRALVLDALGGVEGAYQTFGEVYLAAGKLDEAAEAFEKQDKLHPRTAVLAYNMARVALARDNAESALKQLQTYLKSKQTDAGLTAYELLRDILTKQERGDELIAELVALHEADPDNAPLAYFLAERYRETGQSDKIEATLARSLESEPTIEVYQALVKLYVEQKNPAGLLKALGSCAAASDSLDPLADEVEKLAGDEELVDGLIATGRARLAEDKAAFPFGERLAIAQVALAAGRIDEAAEFFALAIAERPKNAGRLYLAWGTDLLGHEHAERAVAALRQAVEAAKGDAQQSAIALYYLSGALEMAGQTDEALKTAREAVRRGEKLVPLAPLLYSRLGWIAYHAKRYEAAEKAYRQLLALYDHDYESDDTRDVLRETRLVLSNLAVLRHDLPTAEEWLEQVLDEFPDDISAHNDLGYLWVDQGKRLARALRMIEKAVADQPENMAYRDSLGWAYYKLGRFDEARQQLERAAAGDEPDAIILDHLGDAYLATGAVDKACTAWQRALATFDPQIEVEQIKATRQKLSEHGGASPTSSEAQAAKPPDTPPQQQ